MHVVFISSTTLHGTTIRCLGVLLGDVMSGETGDTRIKRSITPVKYQTKTREP
jgi:hypothetical protein